MGGTKPDKLTEAYNILINLRDLDNNLLMQRISMFLLIEAGLLGITATFFKNENGISYDPRIILGFAAFGLLLSFFLARISRSSMFWVDHWQKKLLNLEKKAFSDKENSDVVKIFQAHPNFNEETKSIAEKNGYISGKDTILHLCYLFMFVWFLIIEFVLFSYVFRPRIILIYKIPSLYVLFFCGFMLLPFILLVSWTKPQIKNKFILKLSGKRNMKDKKIKLAIIGVGNCASSLIQGIYFYKSHEEDYHQLISYCNPENPKFQIDYSIKDIEVVAAFDILENKVGKNLKEAIFADPNNADQFYKDFSTDVKVSKGVNFDKISSKLSEKFIVDPELEKRNSEYDIASILRENKVDVVINLASTGSNKSIEYYAEKAAEAGCAFINGTPDPIVHNSKIEQLYELKGLPLAGDDIRSQLGGTITHQSIVDLFSRRNVKIEYTSQKNKGGNCDFINLSDQEKWANKKKTKQAALMKYSDTIRKLEMDIPEYKEGMDDNRECNIYVKGEIFAGKNVEVDITLKCEDSPNCAGSAIDLIRLVKIAKDRKISGVVDEICPFYFKYPRLCVKEISAYKLIEKFIH